MLGRLLERLEGIRVMRGEIIALVGGQRHPQILLELVELAAL